MGRIWRYLSVRSKRVLSVRQVMSWAMLGVGGFHFCLLLLFFYFHIVPLVCINIFSVLLYVLCYYWARKGEHLLLVFNLAYGEIILHAVVATLLLGTDSGFTLYMIAMLPLGYYAAYNFKSRKKSINPMLYVLFSGVAFCFVRIASNDIEPLYTYGNKQIDRTIYMINYFVAVIALVAFFSTLLNQIKILEELRLHQNKQLEKLSKIDPLTGLVNRRSIQERCMQSEVLKEDYAVILGDIDDFKRVNDTYGHEAGDKALKIVSEIFKNTVREEDIVCRWGGEEILVFLPSCSKADAVEKAREILNNIRKEEVEVMNHPTFKLTITLGVAVSMEAFDFDGTMRLADERLYRGKRTGKNQVVA